MTIDGEDAERTRARTAGAAFASPFAERDLPPLGPTATAVDWIAHAEVANGGLEAAWQQWRIALEAVPVAAMQDTVPMLGVEHTLDGGAALDRTGLMLGTDSMANWLLPGRLRDRGDAALQRARAAGQRFAIARLQLARDVATAHVDLALRDREIELAARLLRAFTVATASARAGVHGGLVAQRELLVVEAEQQRAQARLAGLQQARPLLLAALVARAGAAATTAATPALPPLAALTAGERAAIDDVLPTSPEVELAQREHAAALAAVTAEAWERVPQFSLRTLLMGDGAALLAPALTLPFVRDHALAARLRAADAAAAAAAALLRQAGNDAIAAVVGERARIDAAVATAELLAAQVAPRLRQATALAREEWANGRAGFAAWLDAERLAIEVDGELAQLQAEVAIARARLQAALGAAVTAIPPP